MIFNFWLILIKLKVDRSKVTRESLLAIILLYYILVNVYIFFFFFFFFFFFSTEEVEKSKNSV